MKKCAISCSLEKFLVSLERKYIYKRKEIVNIKYMSASIIPLKISQLALLVSHRKHISVDAALSYIYDSPFYEKLYNEDAKWWYLDTESLYKQLEQSRSGRTNTLTNNVIVFLTFCVERYAILKKMTSLQAYALFRRYGVDKYLINGFDVLHTQGEETILHDIELYINNRKKQ